MITVRLLKPFKNRTITYQGEPVMRRDNEIVIRARWSEQMGVVDLGYVTFEPGDYLYEHFYTERWYNVYELRSPDGQLKGWYCNITRPAVFAEDVIESEDLDIDLYVSPDRRTIVVLDEEEYAAHGLETSEPETHRAVLRAIAQLQQLAAEGLPPFQAQEAAPGSTGRG